ncbi:RsmB/NOP family class I SAM-dependent RNA methyltransferase [Mycobacteroides abscessus]|uniref:RsmB/NOP family class I SAM-dependent RNA methyltransferase n=1 Tax=Mycobacteroides abscessus TaxID=36809 RepID=UPI0009A592A0|nr:transcription antitermination factor NusB [Mycobacteroides abscessus]SKF64644.1 ribosomal RNA small subunit methyltransferase B [Mycobacteroides abscessus subsp. bolletii]SKF64990.1 ribosomal RNA small subunit methyltransferase B [Mycobacteroides abscessus subsp. bolletii]SKF89775.1 ribosomal RNA small subunit methyltransferase B [Mycobacteroides abscessus subsp. bolletii]SKG55948.1 ribosomal RNA small subunit methyltransferase B [Mycobacteroides abscessus subsp. bolletii]SKG68509.1 ribosom
MSTRPPRRRPNQDSRRSAGPAERARRKLDPPRRAALDVLRAVSRQDAYANLALPALLRERGITGRDAAFATELTYGTCRARGLLDAVIAAAAGRTIDQVDEGLRDPLRLGAYQLLRTRVEPHAALSTAVDAVAVEFDQGRAGFVNAVLRTISRRDEADWVEELAPPESDRIGRLAFATAHPRWIAQSFSDALGPAGTELAEVLASDDERPLVHLAARPGRIDAEALAEAVGGTVGRYSPFAVYLPGGDPGRLEAVRDGLAQVQDEGSQLIARATTLAPLQGADEQWLDLCAGPGGKTALLGALAAQRGAHVTAVEVAPHRAELVASATKSLPVTVVTADGRESDLAAASFDRVLVDAPCTGLGALRRRPEARWRRQPGDIPALVKLQRELLASAIQLTRPGGVIVYSTCSPHLAETVGVVSDAVRRYAVSAEDARAVFPGVDGLGDADAVQLWPHRHGTDAMFTALLRKHA